MLQYLWLIPIGVCVGAYGTLIGAGGGFVLTPLLLMTYPAERPELITSISLAVVFFNALSGSVAYARMHRIDYRSGVLFSVATIPGAIVGALTTAAVPRHTFDLVFGAFMLLISTLLIIRQGSRRTPQPDTSLQERHQVRDATGRAAGCSQLPWLGMALSSMIGFVSSFLGIGGGILLVPTMVYLLRFPVLTAAATSQFALTVMALTGTLVHIATGVFDRGVRRTIVLALGVLVGAQLGAYGARRVQGPWIMRLLAFALGIIGARMLLQVLGRL